MSVGSSSWGNGGDTSTGNSGGDTSTISCANSSGDTSTTSYANSSAGQYQVPPPPPPSPASSGMSEGAFIDNWLSLGDLDDLLAESVPDEHTVLQGQLKQANASLGRAKWLIKVLSAVICLLLAVFFAKVGWVVPT